MKLKGAALLQREKMRNNAAGQFGKLAFVVFILVVCIGKYIESTTKIWLFWL
jgi:hypothetical protein